MVKSVVLMVREAQRRIQESDPASPRREGCGQICLFIVFIVRARGAERRIGTFPSIPLSPSPRPWSLRCPGLLGEPTLSRLLLARPVLGWVSPQNRGVVAREPPLHMVPQVPESPLTPSLPPKGALPTPGHYLLSSPPSHHNWGAGLCHSEPSSQEPVVCPWLLVQ